MRTVLLVEGLAMFRGAIADVLRRSHFDVLQAASGIEALDVVASAGDRLDVLLLNTELAGMDSLVKAARSLREDVRVVYFGQAPTDPFEEFIREPLRPQDLVSVATSVLEPPAADMLGSLIPSTHPLYERRRWDVRTFPTIGATALQSNERSGFPLR